jgi:hypothetical protein
MQTNIIVYILFRKLIHIDGELGILIISNSPSNAKYTKNKNSLDIQVYYKKLPTH